MQAQQDSMALAAAAKYRGVHMPALRLSKLDAADLTSYIEAQTSRLSDGTQDAALASHEHENHQRHRH